MIGSAEIGEMVMRALIRRRIGLFEAGAVGTIIIGAQGSSAVVRLQGFLARSGYPYQVLDAGGDGEGSGADRTVRRAPDELPPVVCPDGLLRSRARAAGDTARAGSDSGLERVREERSEDIIYD